MILQIQSCTSDLQREPGVSIYNQSETGLGNLMHIFHINSIVKDT